MAWSDKNKDDFSQEYWHRLWQWYAGGGIGHVAAYLRQFDIAKFDPKAPPPKTAAFWDIVDASCSPDDAELADALDSIDRPPVTTIAEVMEATTSATFVEWLNDRKNRRTIPHRMEACGYTPFRNTGAKDGFFKVNGRRQVVYALAELSTKDRHLALADYLKHR